MCGFYRDNVLCGLDRGYVTWLVRQAGAVGADDGGEADGVVVAGPRPGPCGPTAVCMWIIPSRHTPHPLPLNGTPLVPQTSLRVTIGAVDVVSMNAPKHKISPTFLHLRVFVIVTHSLG